MKQVSGKDLARAVQRKGWTLARIQGSHHIFVMVGRRERIVIPVHGNTLLGAYPSITREDILACLDYAASLAEEEVTPLDDVVLTP